MTTHDLFDAFHFDTEENTRDGEQVERLIDFPEKRTLKSIYYQRWSRENGATIPALTPEDTQMMTNIRRMIQREKGILQRILGWLGAFDKTLATDETAYKRTTLPSLLADEVAWRGHTMF